MSLQLDGTNGVLGNSGAFVAGTAVASTSGTSIDFTSIPSWVKRVSIVLSRVSTNGTSNMLVQIGAGSVTTSGYVSIGQYMDSLTNFTTSTAGFVMYHYTAASEKNVIMTLMTTGSNNWVSTHSGGNTGTNYSNAGGGQIALGGTLDRVRITTVNGTDTFDNGSINILYE